MLVCKWNGTVFKLTRRRVFGVRGWCGHSNSAVYLLKSLPNGNPRAVLYRSSKTFIKTFRTFFRNIGVRNCIRPFSMIDHNRIRFTQYEVKRFRIVPPEFHRLSNTGFIKDFFVKSIRYSPYIVITDYPNQLDAYEIGSNIGCGCHAAVYELRIAKSKVNKTATVSNYCNLDELLSDSKDLNETIQPPNGAKKFPLALKIILNYENPIPEHLLWSQMGTELVPLLKNKIPLIGRMANLKSMSKPHPNVVKMYTAFVDRMPVLSDAKLLYSEPFPNLSLCKLPINEPTTLMIVMKRIIIQRSLFVRYRMTLRQYALVMKRNLWKGRVMYGQLLEGVTYLYDQTISHRDLKSDNILLDFDTEEDTPHLVICDFGCALATGSWTVKYSDDSVDLGGNLALRPPEVRCARPGPHVFVDFRLADLWASATLGYEIFTRCNPFYSKLSSLNYIESDLPELPKRVHYAVKAITKKILSRDSEERPLPHVAANVVDISLFRFGDSIKKVLDDCGLEELMLDDEVFGFSSTVHKAFNMLKSKVRKTLDDLSSLYAAETIIARRLCPKVISRAELQLRATFLSRLNHSEVCEALKYFYIDSDL
uniref:non-specific serine/threonine protein kinase n=1 Tax=Syphacia muris TaxID=451379 RepID=A0A0N5AEU0_9BILA